MRRSIAGALVAAAMLGIAEGLCRAFPAPTMAALPERADGGDTMMSGSPWLLWELVPGEHQERGGNVTVNALGMRDRTRDAKRRPRVMALGDSSVYGFGNDDDEVFTSVLESRFDADFVNAAVPGYSSFQALNLLRGRGLSLDPDLVLVATLWSDNNFDAFTDRDLLASYASWEVSGLGQLRAALEASALFRRLDWELRVQPAGVAARKVGWQVGGTESRSGNRRVAIADYARNLASFCELMADRGGGVVYVLLANREDIEPVSHQPAWTPYREVMREAARRCDAPIVDVPAAFVASGRSADALFIDLMHPTALGHRLMADAVEAALVRSEWPKTPIVARPSSELWAAPNDPFEGHGSILESKQSRGLDIELDVRDVSSPPTGQLILAIREPGTSGLALGSQTVPAGGPVRISVSARPETVMVSVTRDTANDGPTQGDPWVEVGPLTPPGDGALVIDLTTVEWR